MRDAAAHDAGDVAETSRSKMKMLARIGPWLGLWLMLYGLVLLVYSKALDAALIYDDAAMLLYFMPSRASAWYDVFLPLDNGFFRPVFRIVYLVLWEIGGTNPLIYRLHSAGVHVMAAVLAGAVFCGLTGARWLAGAAVSFSAAMTAAAFVTVYYCSNCGDSYMTIGMLGAIYCWHKWLAQSGKGWLAGAFAGLLFAMASKETGVAVGGILLLMTWGSGRRDMRAWAATAVVMIVCMTVAGVFYYLQKQNAFSYENQGFAKTDIGVILGRVIKYLAATVLPGSYVLAPMWEWNDGFSRVLRGGLRGITVIVVGLGVAVVVMRRGGRHLQLAGIFIVGAAGMLLPTSLVNLDAGPHSPIGRYLYASLILVMMALGCVGVWLFSTRQGVWRLAAAVWGVWLVMQVIIIRKSPGTQEYYETSREWRALVEEFGRVSPAWPPMTAISVYSGQEYGSFYLDDNYGTAIMRLYYPRLLNVYVANRVIPETSLAYTFDGRSLTLQD